MIRIKIDIPTKSRASDDDTTCILTLNEDLLATAGHGLWTQLDAQIDTVLVEAFSRLIGYERYPDDRSNTFHSEDWQGLIFSAMVMGQQKWQLAMAAHPEAHHELEGYVNNALHDALDKKGWYEDAAWMAVSEALNENFAGQIVDQIEGGLRLAGLRDLIDSGLLDKLEDSVRDAAEHGAQLQDQSSPLEMISGACNIPIVYVERRAGNWLEDDMLQCDANHGSAEKVIPDEGFKCFLRLVNFSARDWVTNMRVLHKVNLTDPDQCRHADAWRALLEQGDRALGINKARPPAVSFENAIEMIDNSNGYGSPTVIINVSLSTMISMVAGKDLLIKDGGLIGVHDFGSGSGHMLDLEAPVVVPADLSRWAPAEGRGHYGRFTFNAVYGFVESAFDADVRVVSQQAPDPSQDAQMGIDL